MMLVAEILPGQIAVVGNVDAARANAVVELASGEYNVLVVMGSVDHVVVEALRATIILDIVEAGAGWQHRPASAIVVRLEDA